jgi:TRAP-type C4-dicarboxylate transport system substrate-binding protein
MFSHNTKEETDMMYSYKHGVLRILSFVSIFLFCGVSAVYSTSIKLSWSTFYPSQHTLYDLDKELCQEIEKRTKGKVTFNLFPGGTLLKGNEMFDGVLNGVTDIGVAFFAYNRGRFPAMEAVDLPLGYSSGMVATKVINKFYGKFQPKSLSSVKVLLLHAHGPGLLHAKKPVYTLNDLNGMKIRCTGFSTKVAKALGASPVGMNLGNTYESLQKGVIDGVFITMESLETWRLGEVINYTTDCRKIGYTTGAYWVMKQTKWDSLPDEVKRVIDTVTDEYIPQYGQCWDDMDRQGREFTLKQGNEIITLSPQEMTRWVEAVKSVPEGYIEKTEEKGLPGRAYVESIQNWIRELTP